MRSLIIGVGAIGSVFLAFLTKAGFTVTGFTKPGREKKKIKVTGIWGEFETPVNTISIVHRLFYKPDLIIISVKSYDTDNALKIAREISDKNTFILIAQNGYGNYEKALDIFGKDRVLLSRVIFGAKLLSDDIVKVTVCADDVVIGDPSGCIKESKIREIVDMFKKSGIPCRYDREVYKLLWDKILYNSALNPLGALLEANYGMLADNPHTRIIMDGIIDEIFDVLKESGIRVNWKDAMEYKKAFYNNMIPPTRDHYPSMLEDIKKGKTEIDSLNGAICFLALKLNKKVPLNETITALVKAKEEFVNHRKL